jgi:hypothetical protein
MSRRTALIVLAVLSLGLGGYLLSLDQDMKDAGGPGIVTFEFAWDQDGAQEILDDWGDEGQDAARKSLWWDYAYLLAYGAFLTLAAAATRDLARNRGWARMAAFGAVAVPLAIAAPAFDALEDVGLLLALGGHGGDAAPLLGSIFACLKFACSIAVVAYLLAGLVRRLTDRRRPARA